jgi:subtilisin
MACPYVSGAGGLVMASGRSSEKARSRLQETAEDVGLPDTAGGCVLLDAVAAATPAKIGGRKTMEKLHEGADDW